MNIVLFISIIYVITFLFFIVILLLSNFSISKKILKTVYIFLSIAYGVIGYYTLPYATDDLTRYYVEIQIMGSRGWDYVISSAVWRDTAISNLILYSISLTGNEYLLPFIAGIAIILSYYFCLIVASNRSSMNSFAISICAIVFAGMVSIYEVLSIARFTFGIAVASIIIILDYQSKLNKIVKIFGYFALPFIHTSLVVILVVKALSLIRNKIIRYTIVIMYPFTLKFIVFVLLKINMTLIYSIVQKIETQNITFYVFDSFLRTLAYFIFTLIFIYIQICSKQQTQSPLWCTSDKLDIRYQEFMFTLTLFCFVAIFFMQSVYFRLIQLVTILMMPILYHYIVTVRSKQKALIYLTVLALAAIQLAYQYILYIKNWQFR